MEEKDLYWLSGILEGEGSFLKGFVSKPTQCTIQANMTDKDVVEKVANLFGTKACFCKSKNPKHKDSYWARIRGSKAVALMELLYPLMGTRRKKQIEEAIDSYNRTTKYYVKLNQKEKEEIAKDILAGKRIIEIANKHGRSKRTVYDIKKKLAVVVQ
jgi:DNA-binding NarL/FixJ family response regulator